MKLAILIFLFPLVCLAALPEGEFLGSRTCKFERAFYDFRLTKTALQKAPKWNKEESDFPPLSPKQAQAAAFSQIEELFTEKNSIKNFAKQPILSQHLRIHMIALESLYATDWIYLVTFDYFPPEGFYSGPPRHFTVPVYLDGSTITPRIRNDKQ